VVAYWRADIRDVRVVLRCFDMLQPLD
jgi:hypothetical protein